MPLDHILGTTDLKDLIGYGIRGNFDILKAVQDSKDIQYKEKNLAE